MPGAPWRIRITDAFRLRFMDEAPLGHVSMFEAMPIPARAGQPVR